jgi:nucleolar MIF4G domain-containing protein 1
VEVLLITVLQTVDKHCKSKPEETKAKIVDIFTKAKEAPQMVPGLQYFLKKKIKSSSLVSSSTERKALVQHCRTAVDAITLLDFSAVDL